MTINEIDQAVRNLIVNQPMITTGAVGTTVNGVLSAIDSFRNFKLTIQSYQSQDTFKFGLLNEIQIFESNFCLLIFQAMQEKGINLMIYMSPENQAIMQNSYISVVPNQNIMGQVMYNNQQMAQGYVGVGRQMGQFAPQFGMDRKPLANQYPPQYGMNNRMMEMPMQQPMQQPYAQNQYQQQYAQPVENVNRVAKPAVRPKSIYPRTSAPTQPIIVEGLAGSEPSYVKNDGIPEPIVKPTKSVLKSTTITKPTIEKNIETKPVKEPIAKKVEDENMDIEEDDEPVPTSKAAGRDYLLQLLKK